jgi:hypothetical protein
MMSERFMAMNEHEREWRQDLFWKSAPAGQAIIAHENPPAHEMFYVFVNILRVDFEE